MAATPPPATPVPQMSSSAQERNHDTDKDDDDLDAELAAVFDEPLPEPDTPPSPPPSPPSLPRSKPKIVPPSPERCPPEAPNRPRSIAEHLLASEARLSRDAQRLVQDARTTLQSVPAWSNGLAGDVAPQHANAPSKLAKRTPRSFIPPSSVGGKRDASTKAAVRATGNAFQVLGRLRAGDENAGRPARYNVPDPNVSNMALQDSPLPAANLSALFEHTARVDIAHLPTLAEPLRNGRVADWVLFGCLVRKHAKRAARGDGGMYAVWTLCNMPRWPQSPALNPDDPLASTSTVSGAAQGSSPASAVPQPAVTRLLLFGDAFAAFHTQVQGAVFALRRPTVMPSRGESFQARRDAGIAAPQDTQIQLSVSRADQLVALGNCKDFAQCTQVGMPHMSRATIANSEEPCGDWYDATRLRMCPRHEAKRSRRLSGIGSTRMEIVGAVRPMPQAALQANRMRDVVEAAAAAQTAQGLLLSAAGAPAASMAAGVTEDFDGERKRRRAREREMASKLGKRFAGAGLVDPVSAAAVRKRARRAVARSDGALSRGQQLVAAAKRGVVKIEGPAALADTKAKIQSRSNGRRANDGKVPGRNSNSRRTEEAGTEWQVKAKQKECNTAEPDPPPVNPLAACTPHTSRQKEYETATDKLLELGFVLNDRGDLLAPQGDKNCLVLRMQRKEESVDSRKPLEQSADACIDDSEDLSLSDESGDED